MNQLAGRRTRAYLLDGLGYLGIAACEVPLGVGIAALGWDRHRVLVYSLSCVPPAPAAVIAARAEAGRSRATWGKRREGLQVVDVRTSGCVAFDRALARNSVKLSVPWQLGHTVAFGAAAGGFVDGDPVTIGATALVYPLVGVMLWTGLRGAGRALHDRVAGTRVRAVTVASGAERPASSWPCTVSGATGR